MTAGEGVGVFTFGKEDDLDTEAFFEEKVDPSESGLDPCSIPIIEDGDTGGEATNESYLIEGKSRA